MGGFIEASGGGGILDFDASRNGPAKRPQDFIDLLLWHSKCFQYERALPPQDVTINHPAMAGAVRRVAVTLTGIWGNVISNLYVDVWGNAGVTDHVLVTHNLGYAPLAFVAYEGRMLTAGTIVQQGANGQQRWVSAYATPSVIGLREVRVSSSLTGSDTLAAASRSYKVLVFKESETDPSLPLFGKVGDRIVGARGGIDSAKHYLRRTGAGDSPFDMDLGRVMDLRNGKVRVTTGGNIVSEAGYTGAYAGGPFVPVTA